MQRAGDLDSANGAHCFAQEWSSLWCWRLGGGGVHVWDCEKVGDSEYVLSQSVLAIHEMFICTQFEHEVLEIEGHALVDCVGFKTVGEPQNLLKSALKRRRPFTMWELKSAWRSLHENDSSMPESQAELMNDIVGHFFQGAEADDIHAAYKRPQAIHEEFSEATLLEMSDIIEEMAEADGVNATDIKTYRQDLAKKSAQRLVQLRDKRRGEKLLALKAKKKRLQVKKFLGKAAQKLGQKRKRRMLLKRPAAMPVETQVAQMAASSSSAPPSSAASSGVPPPPVPGGLKRVRRPAEGNGWQVLEVPHGFLRFNKEQKRLDAHCPVHVNCKMDRTLGRGPVGLCMAWLKAHAEQPHESTALLKVTLSSADGLLQRQQGRQQFIEMSAQNPLFQEVIEHEAKARNGKKDEATKIAVNMSQLR